MFDFVDRMFDFELTSTMLPLVVQRKAPLLKGCAGDHVVVSDRRLAAIKVYTSALCMGNGTGALPRTRFERLHCSCTANPELTRNGQDNKDAFCMDGKL
jgi:hypothetical protein